MKVFTGWRSFETTPCLECGSNDDWQVDARGNVLCDCQACLDCYLVDAYGFHEPHCPQLEEEQTA